MRPVICNHAGTITINDGQREKTDKSLAKNCQNSTEEYSIPIPFYSIRVFSFTDATRSTVSYR